MIAQVAPGTPIRSIEVKDLVVSMRLRFPGSPTIRVDDRDVEPAFTDPGGETDRVAGSIEPRLASKDCPSAPGSWRPCSLRRSHGNPDLERPADL